MNHQNAAVRTAAVLIAAMAVLATACTDGRPSADPVNPPTGTGEVALAALRTSENCDVVAERVRAVLLDSVAYAERYSDGARITAVDAPSSTAAMEVAGTSAGAGLDGGGGDSGGVVVAGSNDQEAGVAEGNTTVTDGRHLFTTITTPTGRELRVVALEDPPRVVGSLPLPGVASGTTTMDDRGGVTTSDAVGLSVAYYEPPSLLLRGDELVVISAGPQPQWTTQPTTSLTLVDVSDPAGPRITSTTTLEGWAVATRMVDDVPRVVLTTTPDVVAQAGNELYSDPSGARALIESIDGDQVLPKRVAADGTVEPLVGCDQVLATPDATASVDDPNSTVSSPELISVVSIGATLDDLSTTTVQGGAGLGTTVYASPAAVYLTSGVGTWDAPTSAIHRIELTDDGSRYTGSGSVPGEVLDQYSLSERNGDLRVVTTTSEASPVTPMPLPEPRQIPEPMPTAEPEPAPAPDVTSGPVEIAPLPEPLPAPEPLPVPEPVPPTEGRLTVLRPGPDGVLAEIGHVDDLGVGERVQSVRFADDIAYVVTFRQVDPLFAIDVSDPTAPRVLGELKIPGFSEYLHPLGDGKILGVGVDADDQGVTRGAKVSLFDVSDPVRPVETAVLSFPDANPRLRGDPLAFTWDPVRRTASFPLDRYAIGRVECTEGPPRPAGPEEGWSPGDPPYLVSPQTCAPLPDPGGPDGTRRVFVRVAGDRLELAREFAPDADGDRRSDESMLRTVVVDDRIHGVTERAVWTFDAELRGPEVRTPL